MSTASGIELAVGPGSRFAYVVDGRHWVSTEPTAAVCPRCDTALAISDEDTVGSLRDRIREHDREAHR
jgi:hypothetical protein